MLSDSERLGPSLYTLVLDGASSVSREMVPVTEASYSEIPSIGWVLNCSLRRLDLFYFLSPVRQKGQEAGERVVKPAAILVIFNEEILTICKGRARSAFYL